MLNLTMANRQIYNFIVNFGLKNGYLPTMFEIQEGLGKAPKTVEYHMDALNEKGAIVKTGKHRYSVPELHYEREVTS